MFRHFQKEYLKKSHYTFQISLLQQHIGILKCTYIYKLLDLNKRHYHQYHQCFSKNKIYIYKQKILNFFKKKIINCNCRVSVYKI